MYILLLVLGVMGIVFTVWFHSQKPTQIKLEKNETFLELLERNEEFVFNYNGAPYEIVYDDQRGEIMLSLYYHDDGAGTYIASFKNPDDFLNHAELQGKPVKQIVDDILIDR